MTSSTETTMTPGINGLFQKTKSIFGGNRYNTSELAGAFGDLGTLIPFVVGYIAVTKMDPVGILVALGIMQLFVGFYFKTPVPIQPMKAVGAAAIANPATISQQMVWGAGLFAAIAWIILALTGAVQWLNKITAKPVIRGVMLGLGLSFCISGLKLMAGQLLLAVPAVIITLILLNSRRLPAMLVLLALGVVISLIMNPGLIHQLQKISVHLTLPSLSLGRISWEQFLAGTFVLGIPQLPLTLGNAVLGTTAQNNELFPDRPVTVRKMALDHSLINAVGFLMGGMPMCHGAGGMAGHVRFGARSGGALVMLGVLLLALGLFFSQSVALIFGLIPPAVLGVILFFAGMELASTVRDVDRNREDIYVLLLTATIATVNVGVGFVAGLALYYALQRRVIKV